MHVKGWYVQHKLESDVMSDLCVCSFPCKDFSMLCS